MPESQPTTPSLLLLQEQLRAAENYAQAVRAEHANGTPINVPGSGHLISAAYEQFRNAAENTEEHLLLQRAIRRFYNRNISFSARRKLGNIGEELIIELTEAGYLKSNSFSATTATRIQTLAEEHLELYRLLRENRLKRELALEWVLDVLPVATEEILHPRPQSLALAYFAYDHFLQLIPQETLELSPTEQQEYELCLYIAIHESLLKSDVAIMRHHLLRMYKQSPANMAEFIAFNHRLTALFTAPLTLRLRRMVTRFGAPMRILKSMADESPARLLELLPNRQRFLDSYSKRISHEYTSLSRKLRRGIIKSIVFLLLSKALIGLAVEIPYDLVTTGTIAVFPLAINLLFPPLYMASLTFGLRIPSTANTQALLHYIDTTLYGNPQSIKLPLHRPKKPLSWWLRGIYLLLAIIPFGITTYALLLLHFNIPQALIFFVFLSTASFLGFRLSRLVRELEYVTASRNLITTLHDLFYLPYMIAGQWLSGKYAKINVLGLALDMMIELPLKTLMRLVRQWARFLREKQEELL